VGLTNLPSLYLVLRVPLRGRTKKETWVGKKSKLKNWVVALRPYGVIDSREHKNNASRRNSSTQENSSSAANRGLEGRNILSEIGSACKRRKEL